MVVLISIKPQSVLCQSIAIIFNIIFLESYHQNSNAIIYNLFAGGMATS